MRRNLLALAACCGIAAFALAGSASAATVTIGQTGGNTQCGADSTVVQTGVASSGASFVVPSGSWTLTEWSTQAGLGGRMAVVVARPTGNPGEYTVVGVSATEWLTASTLNTFTTSIAVQTGDLLGLWVTDPALCALITGDLGDTLELTGGAKPSAGDTLTLIPTTGFVLNISATLTSVAEPAAEDDEGLEAPASPPREPDHSFLCYSTFQVDPGTWLTSEAAGLLAQGYWLPFAEKTTPTGTAIGNGYYLSCQPFAPTGRVVSADGVDLGERAELAGTPGYYPEGA